MSVTDPQQAVLSYYVMLSRAFRTRGTRARPQRRFRVALASFTFPSTSPRGISAFQKKKIKKQHDDGYCAAGETIF